MSQNVWEGRQLVNAAERINASCNAARSRARTPRCSRRSNTCTAASSGKSSTWSAPATSRGQHRQARQAARDSEGRRLRPVVRSGCEGRSLSAQAPLRLALGLQHRQRRHGQPGHPPDGHRPLVPGRDDAFAARSSASAAGSATTTPATRPTRKSCCTTTPRPRSSSKLAACRSRKKRRRTGNLGQSMDKYRGSQVGVVVQCDHGYVLSTSSYEHVQAFDPDGEEIKNLARRRRSLCQLPRRSALAQAQRLERRHPRRPSLERTLPHGQHLAPTGRAATGRARSCNRSPRTSGCKIRSSECSLICGPTRSTSTSRSSRRA